MLSVFTCFRIDDIEADEVSGKSSDDRISFTLFLNGLHRSFMFHIRVDIIDANNDMPVVIRQASCLHAHIHRLALVHLTISEFKASRSVDSPHYYIFRKGAQEGSKILPVNDLLGILAGYIEKVCPMPLSINISIHRLCTVFHELIRFSVYIEQVEVVRSKSSCNARICKTRCLITLICNGENRDHDRSLTCDRVYSYSIKVIVHPKSAV